MAAMIDLPFRSLLLMVVAASATTVLNVSRTDSGVPQNPEPCQQLNLFADVLERVRSDYVERPDDAMLIQAAIRGMLAALDPRSSYLSPIREQARGQFGDLGIEVTMGNGVIKVVSPIDDTPAAKAGLQANDLITHIDNEQTVGLTLKQAIEKMRGPVGTSITLTIVRKGVEDPFDVKLVRGLIRVNPVKTREEGDVALIKISTFNEHANDNLMRAVENAKKSIGEKLKGYVIDLRNNPGGLLDQAVLVSDDFLEAGTIVLIKGRNNEETRRANAHRGDITDGKKIVVLINGGSASASEIVAGALQDHKRATVIGTHSFGMGSVQTTVPLGIGGALRLTTALYYTPSGHSIEAGIEPDIVIEEKTPDDLKAEKGADKFGREAGLRDQDSDDDNDTMQETSGSPGYVPDAPGTDEQLQYALGLLSGRVMQSTAGTVKKPTAATRQLLGTQRQQVFRARADDGAIHGSGFRDGKGLESRFPLGMLCVGGLAYG